MSDATQHPWPAGTRRLQVHDVQIDLRYRQVIRPEQEAELPQRMFELLLVFLAEPQVLHSRTELFARVWPGVIVEDANLSQSVWMLRKALGESRKHWIRTVAKSGYVFEPPAPVEAVAETPAVVGSPPNNNVSLIAEAEAAAALSGTRSDVEVAASAAPYSNWRRWAAAAVLAVAVIGGVPWWLHHRSQPQPAAATPPLAIALIDVEDEAAPEDTRWPVTLLHAWLGWKLESLPEVTLLTEAHLAADSQGRSPRIVFLSSGQDSTDSSNRIFLRARYDEGGREHRFEHKGTRAQLPALADKLSQELLASLMPGRAKESWPRLALDTATARRYTEGVDALEKRDWVASAQILRDVVDRAPDFGLARLQLGHALTRLSRASPAIEQTDAAIELLQPVPKDVAEVLQAERLERDPQRSTEAAAAFAALAAQHPGKTSYALDQARMLLRAGQYKEALAILNQPHWEAQTVGDRLSQRLNLASAYLSMGDAVRSRDQALTAERIAGSAGKGWEQERGEALLLAAQVDSFQYQEKADLTRYEQAAKQFDLAGDDMDALIARFLAESTKPGGTAAGMDALLMQARERGYRRLEIEIL
ncbi:MAG TPA: winged helix-turn-helix domain-containing protein, partial [Lysobacter sp.]|nr:winged helix-turn-helix domain-containing protein [Lysobacter sp.]